MKRERLVGTEWQDEKGDTWKVLEMIRPNLYRCGKMRLLPSGARIATVIFEPNALSLRAIIAEANVKS